MRLILFYLCYLGKSTVFILGRHQSFNFAILK